MARCAECGSYDRECANDAPVSDCGCARCSRVALDAAIAERDALLTGVALAITARDAALAERDKAISGHWVEATCADCRNVFILTPFRCVTCGAARLDNAELAASRSHVVALDAALAEARRVLKRVIETPMCRESSPCGDCRTLRADITAVLAQEKSNGYVA